MRQARLCWTRAHGEGEGQDSWNDGAGRSSTRSVLVAANVTHCMQRNGTQSTDHTRSIGLMIAYEPKTYISLSVSIIVPCTAYTWLYVYRVGQNAARWASLGEISAKRWPKTVKFRTLFAATFFQHFCSKLLKYTVRVKRYWRFVHAHWRDAVTSSTRVC